MAVIALVPMNAAEVRQSVTEIHGHMKNASDEIAQARQKLLAIYQTKSWKALGYDNFQAFAQGEFTVTWQQVYRLVGAAKVDANIQLYSPAGQVVVVKDTHARLLKHLNTPEQQYQAFTAATKLATAEGKDEPEIEHIRRGIQQAQAQVVVDENPLIAHMVAAGEISVMAGRDMADTLSRQKPPVQAGVMALIGKYGLTAAPLVEPLGEMIARKLRGDMSKVLEVLEATGCIGGVPLQRATWADLLRAREEAQQEYQAEAAEVKRNKALAAGDIIPEAVVLTVWKGDMKKTVLALRRALGDNQYERLRDAMLQE